VEHAVACSSELLLLKPERTTPICENCEIDPTEPPKSSLNGENEHPNGAPTEES
jgi:hypothetical protein